MCKLLKKSYMLSTIYSIILFEDSHTYFNFLHTTLDFRLWVKKEITYNEKGKGNHAVNFHENFLYE